MSQSNESGAVPDALRERIGSCPACGVRPFEHSFLEPSTAEVMAGRCPYNDRRAQDAALVHLARLAWDEGALAFSEGRGSDSNPYWSWLEGQPRQRVTPSEAMR